MRLKRYVETVKFKQCCLNIKLRICKNDVQYEYILISQFWYRMFSFRYQLLGAKIDFFRCSSGIPTCSGVAITKTNFRNIEYRTIVVQYLYKFDVIVMFKWPLCKWKVWRAVSLQYSALWPLTWISVGHHVPKGTLAQPFCFPSQVFPLVIPCILIRHQLKLLTCVVTDGWTSEWYANRKEYLVSANLGM